MWSSYLKPHHHTRPHITLYPETWWRCATGSSSTYKVSLGIYILSVYSPFSDRGELPLHDILSAVEFFSVDLKFCHIRFNTL